MLSQKLLLLLAFLSGILFFSADTTAYQNEPTQGPENGHLIIIGGGRLDPVFYETFMKLAGGENVPIVIIPTAGSDEQLQRDGFMERFRQGFLEKGFKNVSILHTRDREEANSQAFIKPLKEAGGVWFMGGRQWRLADSYLNTETHTELNHLLDRGGVIAGTSAGATIQGSYLARGDTKANTIMMGDHEEGLSFIKNIAIDQHLLARNRQFDMFEILDHRPELLGIGLDENTGIVVKKDQFEVIGESYVAIYDGTRWSAERDTTYQLETGSREYYLLKSGQKYDMAKRKIIRP